MYQTTFNKLGNGQSLNNGQIIYLCACYDLMTFDGCSDDCKPTQILLQCIQERRSLASSSGKSGGSRGSGGGSGGGGSGKWSLDSITKVATFSIPRRLLLQRGGSGNGTRRGSSTVSSSSSSSSSASTSFTLDGYWFDIAARRMGTWTGSNLGKQNIKKMKKEEEKNFGIFILRHTILTNIFLYLLYLFLIFYIFYE